MRSLGVGAVGALLALPLLGDVDVCQSLVIKARNARLSRMLDERGPMLDRDRAAAAHDACMLCGHTDSPADRGGSAECIVEIG